MAYQRDPVSVLFDRAARQLLDRVYATPGQWVSTRLLDPTDEQVAYFRSEGIDVLAADRPPVNGTPRLDAHTRWSRGYVRALYYQHNWYSQIGGRGWRGQRRTVQRQAGSLQVDVDGHRPALGVIGAGRIISVCLMAGGQAADRAAERAERERGVVDADATRRDW
jgi:hypothetical protein